MKHPHNKVPTAQATKISNKKAFFAMIFFIATFLYASYESSYDKYMARCTQYNSYTYCESTYR